jgi:hypothetical protein
MSEWGRWASATEHRRYMQPVKARRRCWCGCKTRATHTGCANGIALTGPLCELAARRWVRFGRARAGHENMQGEAERAIKGRRRPKEANKHPEGETI